MCSFNNAQGYIILPIPATPLNPQSFYISSIYWVIFQGIVSNHFILMLGICSFHLFLYVSACIATNCMLCSCLIFWCCILSPITHWSEKSFTDLVNLWWLHLFIIYFELQQCGNCLHLIILAVCLLMFYVTVLKLFNSIKIIM